MSDTIHYRKAGSRDLAGIARVFIAAFPETLEHYFGGSVKPDAFIDVFGVCLDTEPEALVVAILGSTVVGYIFAPSQVRQVFSTFFRNGHAFRMLGGWVSGRYGFGVRPVWIAARNWLANWKEWRAENLRVDARILSVAVHPDAQGRGVGQGLMRCGLDYLRGKGVDKVRLEVRPNNDAAAHLYRKLGFIERGETHDSQGAWLIMVKDLEQHEQT